MDTRDLWSPQDCFKAIWNYLVSQIPHGLKRTFDMVELFFKNKYCPLTYV